MSFFQNEILLNIPAAPRKVRRATSTGCALLIPRLLILYMTIVAIVVTISIPWRLYVEKHGTPVQATVDRRDTESTPKGGQLLRIYYHYEINGRRIDDHKSVSKTEYDQLRPGTHFDGRAATFLGIPTIVTSESEPRTLFNMILLPLLWCALIAIFFCFIWIHPWRQTRLIANGAVALATITDRRETKGRGATYTLYYTFETTNGRRISDKSNVSNILYSETTFLTQIPVFYDPKNPRRNIAYDYTEFIIS